MKPDLSIVVPAYNESVRIVEPLRLLLDHSAAARGLVEIIVVDDGSSDDTASVVTDILAANPEGHGDLLTYKENRGKGFAVRTGLKAARADIALFSDADLSTPLSEIPKLVSPIDAGDFDVTFGSRALDRSLIGTHQSWLRENGGRAVNFMIRKLSGLNFADTQCGFKAFNMKKFRPLLDLMTIDRFGFDIELLFVAKRHGLRLAEIPVRWNDVAGSKVSPFRDTRRMMHELFEIRRNARRGVYDLA